MSRLPRIMITNDDGIYAPGIQHLWQSLQGIAEVVVVAPLSEQSAKGMSLTWHSPLQPRTVEWNGMEAWAVDGTPTDCVKLGVSTLLDKRPDLVLSGINQGSNAGRNVLYSGTVAAAIEATMRGIPSVAFSSLGFDEPNFDLATPYIPRIVEYVLGHPLPRGTLLNINFPSDKVHGIKMVRQGRHYWRENPEERLHPNGNRYYWMGHRPSGCEEREGGDIHLLSQGYATAVPLHVDELTHHDALAERQEHFDQFLGKDQKE